MLHHQLPSPSTTLIDRGSQLMEYNSPAVVVSIAALVAIILFAAIMGLFGGNQMPVDGKVREPTPHSSWPLH